MEKVLSNEWPVTQEVWNDLVHDLIARSLTILVSLLGDVCCGLFDTNRHLIAQGLFAVERGKLRKALECQRSCDSEKVKSASFCAKLALGIGGLPQSWRIWLHAPAIRKYGKDFRCRWSLRVKSHHSCQIVDEPCSSFWCKSGENFLCFFAVVKERRLNGMFLSSSDGSVKRNG